MTMKKTGKPSKDPRHSAAQKAAPARPQGEIFADAMRAFWASQYDRAIALFEQAAQGRDLSIAESAQMHIRMCRRRMESAKPELKTPEQQHFYAVSLINEERFQDALPWLQKAVASDPRPDYQYTLALALGRLGNFQEAAAALRQAVASDNGLRAFARSDPDFAPLLDNPLIRGVLDSSPSAV